MRVERSGARWWLGGTVLLAACGSPPVEPAEPEVVATVEPTPPPAPQPPEASEATTRLLIVRQLVRMVDCGHDEAVGELRCAFAADGSEQPTRDEQTLRLFATEPPGLLLAASDWHPQRALGEAEAVVADCEIDERGALTDVHLGGGPGVVGYFYGGRIPVARVDACSFESYTLPERFAASHLLVMHDDSRRKPPNLSRTREEAIARVREAEAELVRGAPFGDVAARYSDEPGAAKRRGDLGTFPATAMVPEFTFVLMGTKVGEHSAPFESSFGFHVLRRQR